MTAPITTDTVLLPRLIRLGSASTYLGMDKNRFNKEVRPFLTEIPIGKQGIAFDRVDLDRWVDDYKSRNGRPGVNRVGGKPWDAKERPGSANVATGSGTSKNRSSESAFAKALARAVSKKPS